jgi:hypothetical protein
MLLLELVVSVTSIAACTFNTRKKSGKNARADLIFMIGCI